MMTFLFHCRYLSVVKDPGLKVKTVWRAPVMQRLNALNLMLPMHISIFHVICYIKYMIMKTWQMIYRLK